jgi:hypothetical protein
LHAELVRQKVDELRADFSKGGLREAAIRALIYVGLPRAAVDERGFEVIRRLRQSQTGSSGLSLSEFKQIVRRQFLMLKINEEAAMAALPDLLPEDSAPRRATIDTIRHILEGTGPLEGEVAERMLRVEGIFDPEPRITPVKARPAGTKTP